MGITEKEFREMLAGNPDLRAVADAGDLGAAATLQLERACAPTEHEEQVALFAWAAAHEAQHPELAMLFSVPNGGERHPAVAAKMKAEGQKAGVPDVCLPVARGDASNGGKVFHGLFVELKKSDHSNHATAAQKEWIDRLRGYGYSAVVCYGADEAIRTITHYLSLDGRIA